MASICRVIFTTSADASTGTVTPASRALDVFDDPRGVVTDEGEQAAFVAPSRNNLPCQLLPGPAGNCVLKAICYKHLGEETLCTESLLLSTKEIVPGFYNVVEKVGGMKS